jgi:hypothetical protein
MEKRASLWPIDALLRSAKVRAFRKGLPYNLTRELVVPLTCPLLGIPLKRGKLKIEPGSPSIDRKNPTKGYTMGNVWVISFRANAIKQDATLEELELLVKNLRALGVTSS